MTDYTFATLDKWADKVMRRADYIVAQSTNDAVVMASRTSAGKMRGGSIRPGYVPRDTGFLAASFVSSLNGSTALTGPTSHVLVVANMKAGDIAQFGWTAVYARAMHYAGWLWVDVMANEWQRIVTENIVKAKAVIR